MTTTNNLDRPDTLHISVRDDYSHAPGPRYRDEGAFSGEEFRETIVRGLVAQAVAGNLKLTVDLDGTKGYGTSFLEEVFGGLIREDKISYQDINNTVNLISEEEVYLIDDINKYIRDAFDEESK